MRTCAFVRIELLAPWLTGAGRGRGRLYDATTRLDDKGMPFIPARHLRGLLRRAVENMPTYQGLDGETWASFLFGAKPEHDQQENDAMSQVARANMPPDLYFGSLLRVGSAYLPEEAAELFGDDTSALFLAMSATAMNAETGTAQDKSLRSIQTAAPMALYARLDFDKTLGQSDSRTPILREHWVEAVERASVLVRSVGKTRSRGFGRAALTIHAMVAA